MFVPAVRGEDGTFLKKRCIYAVSAGNATPEADQGDDGCGTALFRPGKASVGVCGALGVWLGVLMLASTARGVSGIIERYANGRTHFRRRSKDHTDASVARRDALPWPVAHLGVGSPIVDSPIWMQRGGGRTGCACPRNVGRNPYKPSKTCTCTGEPLLPTVPSLSCIEFWLRID